LYGIREGRGRGDPALYAPARTRAREGDQGVIKICKTVLSGAAAGRIREQTQGLAPGQLRELAVQLAADPDLSVSVITYDDGRAELEVLHTGLPRRTGHTTDCCRFERDPAPAPAHIRGHPGRAHRCR
jgi:hypothetical protein